MFKAYSSKSAATKGATRNGFDASIVQQNAEGAWGFEVPSAEEVAQFVDVSVPPEVANATNEVHPALTEAGFTVDGAGATVPADASKKRTIEKEREARNGVKRPSAGGMCRAVWDWCDAQVSADGTIPSAKQVKEAAASNGWNPNNASIEYYNWRKFMGVRARATTLPEAK